MPREIVRLDIVDPSGRINRAQGRKNREKRILRQPSSNAISFGDSIASERDQNKKDAPPPQLILTPKGSLDQCVFADATIAALKAGKPAKLTLNSHSGAAIGKKYEEERRVSYVKKSLRFRPSLRLFS